MNLPVTGRDNQVSEARKIVRHRSMSMFFGHEQRGELKDVGHRSISMILVGRSMWEDQLDYEDLIDVNNFCA